MRQGSFGERSPSLPRAVCGCRIVLFAACCLPTPPPPRSSPPSPLPTWPFVSAVAWRCARALSRAGPDATCARVLRVRALLWLAQVFNSRTATRSASSPASPTPTAWCAWAAPRTSTACTRASWRTRFPWCTARLRAAASWAACAWATRTACCCPAPARTRSCATFAMRCRTRWWCSAWRRDYLRWATAFPPTTTWRWCTPTWIGYVARGACVACDALRC